MKLDEKIARLLEEDDKINSGSPKKPGETSSEEKEKEPKVPTTWYSYEYFPPKTAAGEENLVDRIARMATTNPLWVDVTWRAQAGLCESTIELCSYIT